MAIHITLEKNAGTNMIHQKLKMYSISKFFAHDFAS